MPWSAREASGHTKEADTPKLKRLWANAANSALSQYDGDEGRAVRVANAAVNRAKKKTSKSFFDILLKLVR